MAGLKASHPKRLPFSHDSSSRAILRRVAVWRPNTAALLLFYISFALLLVTRRPDLIAYPQFWAEEGTLFFKEACTRPAIVNITTSSYGYFDVLLRMVSQAAAAVPLQCAPALLVVSAVLIQALVPAFVVSSRCESWMGNFVVRLIGAAIYCGMPNSFETHCIALHSRVHAAVLASLILVSSAPRTVAGKVFDALTLLISGLSGPFVLVLAPVAGLQYVRTRREDARRHLWLLSAAFLLAIVALLCSANQRRAFVVGPSWDNLVRIVGGQFTAAFFAGANTYRSLIHQPRFGMSALGGCFALLGIVVAILTAGTRASRYLLLIGTGVFAIALAAPLGSFDMPQWRALWSIPGFGQRYYFVPMAMLLFSLVSLLGRGKLVRGRYFAAALLLLLTGVGVRVDWSLPRFTNLQFPAYARKYEQLAPGQKLRIPINPPGWQMELTKPGDQAHLRTR